MKVMKRMLSIWIVLSLLLSGSLLYTVHADAYALLQPGDSGEAVLALQTRLAELGYELTELNGIYDEETEKAVLQFQRENHLLVTGIADQTTQELLFSVNAVRHTAPEEYALTDEFEDGLAAYEIPAAGLFIPMTTSMPYAASVMAKSNASIEFNRDSYALIKENGFQSVASNPFSTFAADVDTSSYAQLRSRILRGEKVPADSVRTEEILNYFRYTEKVPEGNEPFGVTMELTDCPWNEKTRLLRVLLNAKTITKSERTPRHLIFLIDTSGSMQGADRLDLVKRAFQLLLENMGKQDHVSIVTYASREDTVAEYVSAADKTNLMAAISGLEAGGYTNGSAGLLRAYEIADKYTAKGVNTRILLATDGDLNVGVTSEGDLARLVMDKKQGGTYLTVLGFGYGNYQDDRLQALANYGDGNCYYIDTIYEARKALITEGGGTFDPVASDVKIQLDFNPAMVRGYRLIGYENKLLAAEDFANDEKDGGDIGSGQQMTALYEIVPVDSDFEFGSVESKYTKITESDPSQEWLTLNLRAKVPGEKESTLYTYPLIGESSQRMSKDMLFAAGIAETSMTLRDSDYKGSSTYAGALELLRASAPNGDPYREEFVYLVTLLERADVR